MNVPWLDNGDGGAANRLQQLAVEMAEALAGPYASDDGRTFPCFGRSTRTVQFQEPAIIDEEQHRVVTEASVKRAEKKAERRAHKHARRAENKEVNRQLLATMENLLGKK